MWAESEEAAASTSPSSTTARPRTIAEIACQLCRRRKVKCDRTLPHCQVCIQTNQVCEYPLKPKKPGPKIGSLQRHKRRYRDREGTETTSTSKSTASTARNTAGREKRSSRSPGSSASDAEGTNGATTNGTSTNGAAAARPRVRRSRGEAFESVFESVFEDDDEDEEEQARPTRRESSKRQAPAQTEKTTERAERTERTEKRTGTSSPGNTANGTIGTNDEWTQRRRNSRLNINDLSFILHPSHEASTPEKDGEHGGEGDDARPSENGPQNGPSPSVASPQALSLVQQACSALGVSESMLRASIQGYFANMVAINLFHEPSFADKLANIASPVQLFALLTAMMGYAVRFQTEPSSAASQQPPAQFQPSVQPDTTDHIDPMLVAMPGTPIPAATSSTTMPPPPPPQPALPSPEHFLDMARRLIERALDECGDDPPTLVILQACIICTHCELTRGVHGRAWRSLGMCVRLAYEMNLHLIDAKTSTASTTSLSWRDAEEKRRAWWAIWEMDVFASTIRRTPTAVDWTQMETLLPVDDKDWFAASASNVSGANAGSEANGDKNTRDASEARTKEAQEWRRRRSCFMELDPVRRWKALQSSGNHSPKAWFLVINSLMKDARIISSPRGVPFHEETATSSTTAKSASASPKRRASPPGPSPVEEARQKLEILANCVQCFVLALPVHLQYRNQFLGFGEGEPQSAYNLFSSSSTTPVTSQRQLHCGIYNIYVMTQLTRLMIHRYELFGSHAQHFRLSSSSSSLTSSPTTSARHPLNNPAVLPYFEAADNILTIVNRSCQEHIQHINPFLLSTLWLAAAVQLVRRHVAAPRGADRANPSMASQQTLIKSRFDVLYLTYKRCAAFWNARTAMEQNLEALETQLEGDQGGQSEDDNDGEEVEEEEIEATNKRDRSVSREDDQQRKKKRTRATKEKEKPTRVNGTARTQTSRASVSAPVPTSADDRQYTSWTRSNSQPQLSPASTAVQQAQSQTVTQQTQTVTQAQQQMALALAHPSLQHPSMAVPSQQAPPAPLSTYSDPTGASSTFIDGDIITSAGNGGGGGSGSNSASHISPTAVPFGESSTTSAAVAAARPRRPPSALNYFKFDSPGHHHSASTAAHANGYEPAPTPGATTNGVDAAQAQALLTFMQMSRNNAAAQHNHTRDSFVVDNSDLDVPLSMISPALFEPDLGMDDMQQQQGGGGGSNGFEWRGLDLPMDIHDLLSGFSAY